MVAPKTKSFIYSGNGSTLGIVPNQLTGRSTITIMTVIVHEAGFVKVVITAKFPDFCTVYFQKVVILRNSYNRCQKSNLHTEIFKQKKMKNEKS